MADDFCSAATAQSLGIVRGTAYWYTNWTGRFSASLLDSLFGYAGPAITPFVTGIVLTLWCACLIFAVRSTLSLMHERAPVSLSVTAAAIILFVILELTPSVAQSLYWGQGMRSVIPPLILATVYIALLAKSLRSAELKFGWIVGMVLTFVAGGFSETYVAAQTVALCIAIAFILFWRRRRDASFALLLSGLLGSLSALCVVWLAPGNAIRRTPFPEPPKMTMLLGIAFTGFTDFFYKILSSPMRITVIVGLVLFGFVLGAWLLSEEKPVRVSSSTLLLLPIAGFVVLFVCHIPIAYGASLNLPDRALVIPTFVLVVFLFAWSLLLGSKLGQAIRKVKWAMPIAIALLIMFGASAVYAGIKRARLAPTFKQYAQDWELRDRSIRAARSQHQEYVEVPRLFNWAALDEIEPDPKILWLTKCVQDYYGIKVVTNYDGASDPNADSHQSQIESAADAIKPIHDSSPASLDAIYHAGRGVVHFYTTTASYEEVRAHYESELVRNGWRLFGDRKLEIFQKYPGAMHVLYCKDGYAANLFYTASEAPRLGYNYSIAFNWGLSSGFVWGKEDCR